MKKKVLCLILAALMVLSVMPATAFAAQTKCERPLQFEENIAAELKKLNLFKGVSETDFALRKVPTRIEALVIMLRLMGKESEILAGAYTHPFTDVPSWANNYVGYAYENGLTKGISASKFGTDNATDVQFLTFVLRAMGYSDADGDFTWDNPYDLAKELGILDCSVTTGKGFLRADCASISYNALGAKLKDEKNTLADKLVVDGVFTKAAYAKAQENVPDYAMLIKAYGLEGVQWYNYPEKINELTSNFFQCFLRGNYEFITNVPQGMIMMKNGEFFTKTYIPIMQSLAHLAYEVGYQNGKYYIHLLGAESPLSPREISGRMIEAFKAAGKIRDDIYSKGLIKNGMSQMEIANVYSNYLMNNVNPGTEPAEKEIMKGHADDFSPKERGRYILYDGVYSILVTSTGSCTDRVATYNLFMNMEGIPSAALLMTGHMTSLLILDGTEYSCDWGNRFGIIPVSKVLSVMDMIVESKSLERGRQIINNPHAFDIFGWSGRPGSYDQSNKYGHGTTESNETYLPSIYWEYQRTDGENDYYLVKLSDTNRLQVADSTPFVVMYHSEYHGCNYPCTFGDLKSGMKVCVNHSTDKSWAKDGESFKQFMVRKP